MTTLSIICKKRLLGDLRLIKRDPHQYIDIVPDEKNMLIWYFLIKGPEFSDYINGYYIGEVLHHESYPFHSPDFVMLTPSGRFNVGTKICLSNSSYHSSEWSAMWNIHAILTGFLSIMLDDNEKGISHIFCSKEERKFYAKNSIEYNKKNHLNILKLFSRFLDIDGNPKLEEITIETKLNNPKIEEQNNINKLEDSKFEICLDDVKQENNQPIIEIKHEDNKITFEIIQEDKQIELKTNHIEEINSETNIKLNSNNFNDLSNNNFNQTMEEYKKIMEKHKKKI